MESIGKLSEGESFSRRIRELRGERSKAQFCREIGIKPPVYQLYEEGRLPRVDMLSLISGKCGVSVAWLVGHTDERNPSVPSPDTRKFADAVHARKESSRRLVTQITEMLPELLELRGADLDRRLKQTRMRFDELSEEVAAARLSEEGEKKGVLDQMAAQRDEKTGPR